MSFSVQSKSQLAKLLATENIRIEHRKLRTASFDPKNRVLYCPIWKDMSNYLYDLLLGHEVGHALYTPADGWHDAACSNGKNFKAFLNVVEDARIEKKVKRKYPGLRASFVRAYKDLMEQDFFGVQGKNLDRLSFINRLNLHTKSDYTLPVQFNAREKMLLDRVRAAETWQDVLDITGDIWQYAKEEKEDEEFEFPFEIPGMPNIDQEGEDDFSDELDDGPSQDGDGDDEGESEESSDGDGEIEDEEGNKTQRFKDSTEDLSDGSFNEPTCETDDIFRERESQLLDEKSKDYVYVKLPKPNLEDIVTPVSRVQELLTKHFKANLSTKYVDDIFGAFKKRNEKYISLLAKEFEMRKAAARYAKARVTTTGDIDISRVYKYQVDDNIFRKAMKVPNGKSHGLVMMFDRSGSMHRNMRATIEQMLVLVLFCRKVNIPFVVYGFGNSGHGWNADYPNKQDVLRRSFSSDVNTIDFSSVCLREYINSRLTTAEFTKAVRNLVCLMECYPKAGSRYSRSEVYVPNSEQLSNTPMNEAFVALEPITKQFQKTHNIDIVNTVLLHDGDADFTRTYRTEKTDTHPHGFTYFKVYDKNNFIVDEKMKKEYPIKSELDIQKIVMQIYTARTNSKIFGFYIESSSSVGYLKNTIRDFYVDEKGLGYGEHNMPPKFKSNRWEMEEELKVMAQKFKKDKLMVSHKKGYNKFFLILGGKDLEIDDDDFTYEGKVTSNRLAREFMKYNQKRQLNRVLVNKFIEGIAS